MVCKVITPETTWGLLGCLDPGDSVVEVALHKNRFIVGRSANSDLRLSSDRVSNAHAELIVGAGVVFVRDLGSETGTSINGDRVFGMRLVEDGDRIEFADHSFRLAQHDPRMNNSRDLDFGNSDLFDVESRWVFSQFDKLMDNGINAHYQPIVTLSDGIPMGYEAFARSDVKGMEVPSSMFDTAKTLDRSVELSLRCREKAVQDFARFSGTSRLFLNTDPAEKLDRKLISSLQGLRNTSPELRIALEINQSWIVDSARTSGFLNQLQSLNIQLAYVGVGSDVSGSPEAIAAADFIKLDMSLIATIDDPADSKRSIVKEIVKMSQAAGSTTIAEGIETSRQAAACRDLGVELGQGYYFGRPFSV